MKTTIDIPDKLFHEANRVAIDRGITLNELFEQGLRMFIYEGQELHPSFRLRDGSVDGEGVQDDLSWTEIRRMIGIA